jgi:rfaE bifunctional protein nucleotidyltransferase chain/domain
MGMIKKKMNVITNIDKIDEFVAEIKKQGKTIAFSNGCFDVLHRGHVAYLEKAKQYADILVLGLNSDSSVRRLKGQNRPYVNQDDRAFVLSRLEAVDIVCLFDDDTPLELLKKVEPNFLIKGGDYNLDQIVGRELVESRGGQVLTIPFIEGNSSTSIIDQIKNR